MPGFGNEGCRRGIEQHEPEGQFSAGLRGDRAVRVQDLVGPLEGPGDEAAVDRWADGVQAEREPGNHAEVAASAPERPEQVGILTASGDADLTVRGDYLHFLEVVDRPPEPTRQVAEATPDLIAIPRGLLALRSPA
jgi:hypothetical protein